MPAPPFPIAIQVRGAHGLIPGELRAVREDALVFAAGLAIPAGTALAIRPAGDEAPTLDARVRRSRPGPGGVRIHDADAEGARRWLSALGDVDAPTEPLSSTLPTATGERPASSEPPAPAGVEVEIIDDSDVIAAPSGDAAADGFTGTDVEEPRPRGRRSVVQALVDADQRVARTGRGGRRPLPVTPRPATGEGPPSALFSKGPPPSALVRLDRDALRRWVRLADDRLRVTVAATGPALPALTAVLQLPDGTFLQFRATLQRARDDALTYESEPLSWGSLLPIRELQQDGR